MEKASYFDNLPFNHNIYKFFSLLHKPSLQQLQFLLSWWGQALTSNLDGRQHIESSFQTKARGCSQTATSSALGNLASKLVIARPQPACLPAHRRHREADYILFCCDWRSGIVGFFRICSLPMTHWSVHKSGTIPVTAVMAGTACNPKCKLCLSNHASSPQSRSHCSLLQHQLRCNCNEPLKAFFWYENNPRKQPLFAPNSALAQECHCCCLFCTTYS